MWDKAHPRQKCRGFFYVLTFHQKNPDNNVYRLTRVVLQEQVVRALLLRNCLDFQSGGRKKKELNFWYYNNIRIFAF